MNRYTYLLNHLDCANCAKKIEDKLNNHDNYYNVVVNFTTLKLTFETKDENHFDELNKIITAIEPDIVLSADIKKETYKTKKHVLITFILGIVLGVSTLFIPMNDTIHLIVIGIASALLLYRTAIKALKILVRNKSLDENILLTISVIGAFLIGDYFEGFMVIALYQTGKLLEEKAVNKSKKSVSELMDIRPEYANIYKDGEMRKVNPDTVSIGEVIAIKKGEKVPLDGILLSDSSLLDTKALTGESAYINKVKDETVLSGSINVGEMFLLSVTSSYEDSTVSKILDLVENATNRKAKTENFVSKAAKVYTPIIIVLSILTGVLLPLLTSVTVDDAIYRALSFLVISCPCAIAISVPLSYFAGIGKSSQEGILVKGSDYLDILRNVKTIVLDKTGTLTTGEFKVQEIVSLNEEWDAEEILKYAASGEMYSTHPIAKSVVEEASSLELFKEIKNFEEVPGKGITYQIKKDKVSVGNATFVEMDENDETTTLYVVVNALLVGKIMLEDRIKDTTKSGLSRLSKHGIRTIMFTGDRKSVAHKVANEIGIDQVKSEMLPQDKYNELEKLIKDSKDKVMFVGDGINDAPVLALADIGVSMGLVGSSSAIEASDVVIMTDDLEKINTSIEISKETYKIIKQNLIFSIGTKLLFIVLNLFGYSTMAMAVFADVGVTVIAILNSIRILKKKFK